MRLSALYLHGSEAELFDLAGALDELPYHRLWIAENQPQASPVLLAALAAGSTERLRVGTAGVLLHFHAPAPLVRDFEVMQASFAGRMDLGFCSSWIGDPAMLDEMLDGRTTASPAQYGARVAALVAAASTARNREPFELWSMGTGPGSAALAAQHGLGYAYSLFHVQTGDDPSLVAAYRRDFVPSPHLAAPRVVVATAGVCAATEAEARALADRWPNRNHLARVVGDPAQCAAQLKAAAARYGCDEIVFADLISGDPEARLASYQLLAEAVAA